MLNISIRMHKFVGGLGIIIMLFMQATAFAATEFYLVSKNDTHKKYCDYLEIKKSKVTCDDKILVVTYDLDAIVSIKVVHKGKTYDFRHLSQREIQQVNTFNAEKIDTERKVKRRKKKNYTCSGKIYCSQMNSCEEAMFYLHNCPGTKMDGDGDGIPCEQQWCGH